MLQAVLSRRFAQHPSWTAHHPPRAHNRVRKVTLGLMCSGRPCPTVISEAEIRLSGHAVPSMEIQMSCYLCTPRRPRS